MNDKSHERPTPDSNGLLFSEDMQLMASISHGLSTVIQPELSSALGLDICESSAKLLDKLVIKYGLGSEILAAELQTQVGVLVRATQMFEQAGIDDQPLRDDISECESRLKKAEDLNLKALQNIRLGMEVLIGRTIPQLFTSPAIQKSQAATSKVNQLFAELVEAIQSSEKALNEASEKRKTAYQIKADTQVIVTAHSFEQYLKDKFPDRPAIKVNSFEELVGGSSKSTIFTDVQGLENDGVSSLVLRMDREAGSTDTKVIDEVSTLKAVYEHGLPVPEVIWIEEDASKVGLPFIVVRKVNAPVVGGRWHTDPGFCNEETGLDLARILAEVHTLDTRALGLRGALNSDPDLHPMTARIDNIRGLWECKKLSPDGMLESCITWLEQHMPPAPEVMSLIHADASFHNILVKDKKIACLLDWELSHLGDPNEDLSYVRPAIETCISWDRFLAEYRRHGGGEYSETIGGYYGIWQAVRNMVYVKTCHHAFYTEANLDIRWGAFAANYPLVLLEACRGIVSNTRAAK